MTRKTSREISRLYAVEKIANPGAVALISAIAVGTDRNLKMSAKIGIGANEYELASDNGRVKIFANVDDVLKYAAKAAEKGDGVYTVSVDTGALLASSVPNDVIAAAESQTIKLARVKNSQNEQVAAIDVQLGLMVGWENGNAAQQAKKIETLAQRACVVTDIAAIDAELVRLAAVIAG